MRAQELPNPRQQDSVGKSRRYALVSQMFAIGPCPRHTANTGFAARLLEWKVMALLCAWRDTRTHVYLLRERQRNACLICSTRVNLCNGKHLKSANATLRFIVAIWLEQIRRFWREYTVYLIDAFVTSSNTNVSATNSKSQPDSFLKSHDLNKDYGFSFEIG